MSDHFPIMIDVEEGHVGKVLRTLDNIPGVVNIHLQMTKGQTLAAIQQDRTTTPNPTALTAPPQRRRQRQVINGDGMSVRGVIAHALHQGPMHYSLISKVLERAGLSGKSVHSAITKMSVDRSIVRIAPGTYRLTSRGERKYIDHKSPAAVHRDVSPGGTVNNRKGLRFLILNALGKKVYGQAELKEHLLENDYSANNMYNIVHRMREEGLIRREGDTYEITQAGREAIATLDSATDADDLLLVNPDQHGDAT